MQFLYSLFTASHHIGSAVSFSAFTDQGWQYPDEGEIIKFPLVMTNNGGHYSTSDSVFTCPLNGTYYFTFSLYARYLSAGKRTAAYIKKDGEWLSEAYCINYGPDYIYIQCGNSVVVHCYLGQHVFVPTSFPDTQLYGYNKRSTFSGFLIHADIPPY